jgi:glycosyltransferase involved in cell wall biosynthesis
VSVIVPAHNVLRYVAEALRSAENQSHPDLELIAIDDGSSDGTAELLEQIAGRREAGAPRLQVVRQEKRGVSAARNAGLQRSERPYVAFLDADDRWHPELLERLVGLLERCEELDLVFPWYRYVDANGDPIGVESQPARERYEFEDLLVDNPIHSATGVVARRGVLLEAGGFDETLASTVDLDLWLRVAVRRPGNIGCVRRVLADYRRREGQITGDWRRMQQGWERVLAKLQRDLPDRVAPIENEARARHHLYWSALAYHGGEYSAARRHVAAAWRLATPKLLGDSRAWVRTAAVAASVLPGPAHRFLAVRFNRIRERLGIRLS